MKTRDDILKELKEIAPKLASLEKTSPYQLPENYFLNFRDTMLEKVKLSEELKTVAPELAKIEKALTTDIPTNYFSSFSNHLVKKIRTNEAAQELAAIAPTLSTLEKINVFEVPANYFGSFPAELMNSIRQEQKNQFSSGGWLGALNNILERILDAVFKPKYSVAFAGIATMMIIGAIMYTKIPQCDDLDCKLAQLSNEDISAYLDTRSDSYSEQIFESNDEENSLGTTDKLNGIHIYKDALTDIDDSALDAAIAD